MPNTIPPFTPTPPVVTPGPVTTASERLYDRLGPLATYDPDNGYIVREIAGTLSEPQQIVDDLARDHDGLYAWQAALDPDNAPAVLLPWLAQFAGVTLQPADSEAQQRLRVKTAAGLHRGTVRAQLEELQLHLTGTKRVCFSRRDPDLWHQTVGSLASESAADAELDAAALSQKPAGVILQRVELSGTWTLLGMDADVIAHRAVIGGVDTYMPDPVYATIGDLEAAFATIALLEAGP